VEPTSAALDDWLTTLKSDSTTLGSSSVGLIAAAFSPSPTLKLADITEANYSGYVRQAVGAWAGPFIDDNGLSYIQGTLLNFHPSDTTTMNTIFGAFMTPGSSSTKLTLAEQLASPIPLDATTTNLSIAVRVALDPSGNFGMSLVSS